MDGFVLNKMLKDGAKLYFGILTALDEALLEGDQALAEAIWR